MDQQNYSEYYMYVLDRTTQTFSRCGGPVTFRRKDASLVPNNAIECCIQYSLWYYVLCEATYIGVDAS